MASVLFADSIYYMYCVYMYILIYVHPNSFRLPPMHIVLLTGHSREHILSEDSTASMLFDSILEKPMQNATLRALIEQVAPIIHMTIKRM